MTAPTSIREAYVAAAMNRVKDFAKSAGEEIGGASATSIFAELKTMFDAGWDKCWEIYVKERPFT